MEDTKICSLGKMRKLTNTAGAASIKAAAFPPTLRKASVALGSNKARIKIPAVSAFDKSAVTQIPLLGTSNFTFAFVVGEFNRWMHQLRFFHIPAPRF